MKKTNNRFINKEKKNKKKQDFIPASFRVGGEHSHN